MSSTRGPPQLMFDDGSRVMMEDSESNVVVPNESSEQPLVPIQRGSIPLHVYYEINRMSTETIDLLVSEESSNSTESTTVLRIALQFPDELLQDSPEVCWLLEDKIREELEGRSRTNIIPFCFVLGDTTVNSCCPDEVAALHLNADVLIHYGHACLSPTGTLPVLYSFGKLEFGDLDGTVSQLQAARSERSKDDTTNNKFLVLYQVGYHHAMKELQERWMNEDTEKSLQVVVAEIPALSQKCNQRPKTSRPTVYSTRTGGCCQSDNSPKNNTGSSGCCGDSSESPSELNIVLPSSSCCNSREKGENCHSAVSSEAGTLQEGEPDQSDPGSNEAPLRPMVVGGLELPRDQISSWDDLVDYTVLFIMGNPESDADKYSTDDNTTPQQRHYANSMLCFLSLPHGEPQGGYWIYSPKSKALRTNVSPPPAIRRQLKRRFFLTQKARDANVFGILVSNLSQQYLVDVVKSLQRIIQDADRTAYSFAVGKINPAKLSNFAEIETFVMVACRENSLLDQEREYPIPVITPMELEIALENLRWGMQPYSLDCQDVMIRLEEERQQKQLDAMGENTDGENANDNCSVENDYDNDDSDAPYFSMITGRYESRKSKKSSNDLDLRALPGQGQVTEYKSEAANFLKQREYQGLESKVGETEAKAAVLGMRGIASGYDK